MVDNTQLALMVGGDLCATDDIPSGVAAGAKVQRVKVGFGVDGSYVDAAVSAPLPVAQTCTGSTVTGVASSATNVMLLAANTNRRQAIVFNDSTSVLYVKLGTVAAATSYSYQVPAGGYLELPVPVYTGQIDGIWSTANGTAMVTELT